MYNDFKNASQLTDIYYTEENNLRQNHNRASFIPSHQGTERQNTDIIKEQWKVIRGGKRFLFLKPCANLFI